jgi:hypothetical protein
MRDVRAPKVKEMAPKDFSPEDARGFDSGRRS